MRGEDRFSRLKDQLIHRKKRSRECQQPPQTWTHSSCPTTNRPRVAPGTSKQRASEYDYRGVEPQPEHLPPQPQLPLPQAEPHLPQPGRLSRQRTSAPLPRPRSSSDTESPVKSPQPKRKGKAFSKSAHPSQRGGGRPATPRVGEEEEEE
ncbi:hypothetical protein J4Q44_G00159630 [Coregonus suidteri]|uniref:Uncharacterized protein n=1 Tax=Coregonus suidteri TaxID=861788 RepID=A0AAN8LQE0_9TELE